MVDLELLEQKLNSTRFSESYVGSKVNHEAVYLLFREGMPDSDKTLLELLKTEMPNIYYEIFERSNISDLEHSGIIEKEKGKLASMMHDAKYFWIQYKITQTPSQTQF